jgi:hypothetical protein
MAIRYVTPGYAQLVMDLGAAAAQRKVAAQEREITAKKQLQAQEIAAQKQIQVSEQAFRREMAQNQVEAQHDMAQFESDLAVQRMQMAQAWDLEKMRRRSEIDFEFEEKARLKHKEEKNAEIESIFRAMENGEIGVDDALSQAKLAGLRHVAKLEALDLGGAARALAEEVTYHPSEAELLLGQREKEKAEVEQTAVAEKAGIPDIMSRTMSFEQFQTKPETQLLGDGKGNVYMIDPETQTGRWIPSAQVMTELQRGNMVVSAEQAVSPWKNIMKQAALVAYRLETTAREITGRKGPITFESQLPRTTTKSTGPGPTMQPMAGVQYPLDASSASRKRFMEMTDEELARDPRFQQLSPRIQQWFKDQRNAVKSRQIMKGGR